MYQFDMLLQVIRLALPGQPNCHDRHSCGWHGHQSFLEFLRTALKALIGGAAVVHGSRFDDQTQAPNRLESETHSLRVMANLTVLARLPAMQVQ